MVKAFHDVGMKVYIDVVYNHTGEGGAGTHDKTTIVFVSWTGQSDLLFPHNRYAECIDNTGVGGNFNTYNPIAQNLIIDSLAYWRDTMGVDGFRFDLASVLGNTCQNRMLQLRQA